MKHTLILLLLITTVSKIFSQNNYPPIITDKIPKYNVVYAENATYQYTLNTENISTIKPQTTIMKLIIFESEKQAYLTAVYVTEEVQLVDHDLKKTKFKYESKEEIPLKVNIYDDKISLTNTKLKQKILLKITGYYDDISLKNTKTGEVYTSQNTMIEKLKKYRMPPLPPQKNNSKR